MLAFLLGLFILYVNDVGAQLQDCYRLTGQLGNCVLFSQCPSVMNIFYSAGRDVSSPQYIDAIQKIRDVTCGFMGNEAKVCCNYAPYSPNPPNVSNHPKLNLLDHNICGVSASSRIFDGENTGIFENPWMALLLRRSRFGGALAFHCAGTIINKRHILTAAHCIKTLPQNYFLEEVRVGEHDTNQANDCDEPNGIVDRSFQKRCTEGFQTFHVDKIFVHNGFNMQTFQDDIALLRLDRDINFTPLHVRPICLPIGTASAPTQGQGIVTGWGRTRVDAQSTKLLKVHIPIVPNEACDVFGARTTYKQICAGRGDGYNSCTGDSGGPLQNVGFYRNFPRQKVIQYGIISYGSPNCSALGIPAVYTSVSYYIDWILDNMIDEFDSMW